MHAAGAGVPEVRPCLWFFFPPHPHSQPKTNWPTPLPHTLKKNSWTPLSLTLSTNHSVRPYILIPTIAIDRNRRAGGGPWVYACTSTRTHTHAGAGMHLHGSACMQGYTGPRPPPTRM